MERRSITGTSNEECHVGNRARETRTLDFRALMRLFALASVQTEVQCENGAISALKVIRTWLMKLCVQSSAAQAAAAAPSKRIAIRQADWDAKLDAVQVNKA